MTVASGGRLEQAGNGTTTEFFPTFWAKDKTALTVTLSDDSGLSKTDQVLDTDYTVSFASGTSGVPTITFVTAPASGFTVIIVPVAVVEQDNDISGASPIFGSSVEEALDQIVAIIQSIEDRIENAVYMPQDDTIIDILPDAKDRQDKYLFFNETTGQPEVKDLAVVQADLGMLDDDLADIAALTPTNDDVIQRKAGEWTNRTMAQLAVDLLVKIADGTVAAPSIAFASDTDTGIFRVGANEFALVTNGVSRLILDGDGNITTPTTPAFLAFANSDILNQTGNGTAYDVVFNDEVHDRNSDYDNSTGVFTAPKTGLYSFSGAIKMFSLGTSTSILVQLVTSNRTYDLVYEGQNDDGSNIQTVAFSAEGVGMGAADTAKITLTVNGAGGDTVDIDGDASAVYTFFSGRLVG